MAAAIDAAVDALGEVDLSDDALFAADADAEVLARTIRRQLPGQPRRAGLSDGATVLYGRALDQACRYLIQVIRQLPAFQPRALAEVLDRLSTVAGQVTELLAHVPRTSLDAPHGSTHDDEFRTEYLRYLANTLDRLELLGLSMRDRPRLALSVAYLSLTVSEQDGQRRRPQLGRDLLAEHWFGQSAKRDRTSIVRVESAIGAAQRTLVRGEAGSGKTTLLDWLAVTAARGGFTDALADWNQCVPFPVRLRRFADTDLPRPEQFLEHAASWLAGIMPEGWVHRCLRSGQALVLVDGVDEVPATRRRVVRAWLGELVTAYPEARVVVTARPAAAEERWLAEEGFAAVLLEQMSASDVRLFLERWHEAAASTDSVPREPADLPEAQRRLVTQLDARPHLRALAANPLLCAMLCALNLGRRSELPRNRMELYQAAIAMLVDLRDAERNITGLLDVTEKTVLLRDLAWRLTLGGRTELPRDRARELVAHKLTAMPNVDEQPSVVLDHLLERSGVIREPVPGRLDFVHRTFQEYLAASEATEEEHIDTLAGHAHLDAWRETIIMACGHAKRSQSRNLLTAILDRADTEPRHARHLRLLAAGCLETITDLDPEVATRLDQMITTLLLPPRSTRETRSLAGIGHRLLRYLPSSLDGLSDAAAHATVQAAAYTNNIEALSRIARYAQDQRQSVQTAIIEAWQYFDPERYANEVLADAPLVNGHLIVRTMRFLPYVSQLQHLTSLSIQPPSDEVLDDLRVLAGLPFLVQLYGTCAGVTDLSPLAEHQNLKSILLLNAERYTGIRTLRRLPKLKYLVITGRRRWSSIEFVRQLPTLEALVLNSLQNVTDFNAFRELDKIITLRLDDCNQLQSLDPLRHLKLRDLHLNSCDIHGIVSEVSRTFPHLIQLTLNNTDVSDLTPLSGLKLVNLAVVGCPVRDLTPLAGKNLTLGLTKGQTYHGLDQLGPRAKVSYS